MDAPHYGDLASQQVVVAYRSRRERTLTINVATSIAWRSSSSSTCSGHAGSSLPWNQTVRVMSSQSRGAASGSYEAVHSLVSVSSQGILDRHIPSTRTLTNRLVYILRAAVETCNSWIYFQTVPIAYNVQCTHMCTFEEETSSKIRLERGKTAAYYCQTWPPSWQFLHGFLISCSIGRSPAASVLLLPNLSTRAS